MLNVGQVVVIDLDVISVAVDMVLDKFLPFGSDDDDDDNVKQASYYDDTGNKLESRIDVEVLDDDREDGGGGKKVVLKDEITTVVGALLDKQECWEKSACVLGRRTSHFAAKDVFFMSVFNLIYIISTF